ncbi:C28H8.4, partial [Symbiodinium sp. KB8]
MASFAVNDKCCRHHPGGGLRRFLACLQLLGLLLSLGGMDGNNNDGKQDSRPPPWSDEEIAARNAAAWEDECWTSPWTTTSLQNAWDDDRETGHATATAQLCSPVDPVASINQPQPGVTSTASSSSSWEPLMVVTSQTSSSSSWGSNGNGSSSSMQLAGISETLSAWDENLSLSLQEEEIHLVSSLGALGGALPLAPIPEEIPHPFGLPPLQETSAMASASQQLDANDLLAKLSDGRPLRGRPPAPLRGEAALPHARDPSSLATPKGNSPPKVGEIDWSSPGVTQRGSRTRPGIDRWHNLDGTIRYRLREEQSQARGPATSPPTDRPSDPSSIGSDLRPEATQHASSHTSFYDGKAWQEHAEEPEVTGETSTCDPSCTEGGTWRPAWLERYIEDKKRREDTAPGHIARRRRLLVEFFFVEHLLELFVAVYFVELDYFVYYHYGAGPPGARGLPAQLRLLQEAGVPELRVERIDLLLECLEDHQAADHGPEARWALARLVRRLEDAQASLQVVLEVLARRLRPRGYLPVTRVPHARAEQVRLLTWMINSAAFVTETLEFHLRTPLQPDETTLAAGPRASPPASPVRGLDDEQAASSADGEAAASSSSPHGIVMSSNASCRSRSRSPPPRLPDNTLDYTMGADAFGLDICLLPTERDDEDMDVPLSSVPEGIQRALDGELLVCIHHIDYVDFRLDVYVDFIDYAVYYPVDAVAQYDDNLC